MNVFDLFAKISLDSSAYQKGLQGALSLAKSTFKGIGIAIGGATTAIGGLVTASTEAYAEYEQLVGGVNKLFGDASEQIQKYASEAYKTSGLSANEYMEQATSFSASLINSLEGDVSKAAELTDVAMRAISDNVNTFGTDITSVQNAFQGFAKQNYTIKFHSPLCA